MSNDYHYCAVFCVNGCTPHYKQVQKKGNNRRELEKWCRREGLKLLLHGSRLEWTIFDDWKQGKAVSLGSFFSRSNRFVRYHA